MTVPGTSSGLTAIGRSSASATATKAEAREAAVRMRARETSLQYVDIVAMQVLDGEALKPRPVDSI
jgi:hypothetical protein